MMLIIFSACVFIAYSQQLNVKGTVLDNYGHPLKGVEIKIKNTNTSVVSNEDGSFDINAVTGSVLVFTSERFNVSEVKVLNTNPIIARLSEKYLRTPHNINVAETQDTISIAATSNKIDVLYELKDADKILGSVSSIYTNQLTTTPAPLYAYSLAGRLPGLYTQQTRGWVNTSINAVTYIDAIFGQFPAANSVGVKGPNDNSEIYLRLRGQTPITIIDGVQRDIYTISPENIESVTVLKDALSTILLGQRSSGGVILVTTKKPRAGTPHVSFTAQTGIQEPLKLPAPLEAYQYAYLYNEALLNDAKQTAYSFEDFEAFRNGSDPYGHPNVNWFNTILKDNSSISRYDLNVSGGGRFARYSVGLGYLQQDGLFKANNPDYNTNAQIKRYTINTNIDVDVTQYFKTNLQIYGRIQDGNQPGATTNAIMTALYTTPNNAYPVFNPDGSLGGSSSFTNNIYGMLNNSGYITDYTRDITSNLVLTYKFDKWVKGLWAKAQSNLSVYASNASNRSKTSPVFKMNIDATGDTTYNRYGNGTDQLNNFLLTFSAQYWYAQASAGYDRAFGKSTFGAKLFYDRLQSIFNYDLPETNQNIAATASYDYDKKYFAEAAINYSGNNRYPPNKQFGLFYAAGLGWDIAKENFIKDNSSLHWINKIKLRATYGKTGNANVGYFTWRESFNTDVFASTATFGIDRTLSVFQLSQLTLANPNVTWEKANKFNVGIDVSLFQNHFQFTAEYYNNKYYDLMQKRGKQSAIIGISYPLENIGINRYTGKEFTLTYQNNFGNFNYFITANASFEKSKVLFMDEIQAYPWNARTGQPVGMIFGYKADGFIQTQEEAEKSSTQAGWTLHPGDLKLRDMNGDGTINQYDQVPIGSDKPLLYYGVTAGFSFKGFDISVLLQGVENRMYLLGGDYSFGADGKGQAYDYIVGRWIPETANTATYPRLTAGFNNNNDYSTGFGSNANSFWVHSGDYFRIKNIDVGYTLPYKWTNSFKISAIRFFANGLNLFTHAAFDRVDPEVNGQVYPIQRVINFGVNVKF